MDLCGYCGCVVEWPCQCSEQADRCVVYLVEKREINSMGDVLNIYQNEVSYRLREHYDE